MALDAPIWNAFNAGELSPLLDGRTDQEKYFSGCKVLENFIPTVQGPAVRRGGTRFLDPVKDNGLAWLLPFEFSSSQSYVLELGNNYMRFWVNRGQLLSVGVPYEIATPWTLADLFTVENTFALRTVQSGDVMWIDHEAGEVQPYKLERLGATNWTLTKQPFLNGPFKDVDPLNTVTVKSSVATGAGTLTASAATFRPSDVGTSFYLESDNPSDIVPWEPAKTVVVNDIRRYSGNVYQATIVPLGAKTGTYPPVHLRGTAQDGEGGVTWVYLHSGYGWASITAYTSSTLVSATVISCFPAACVNPNTTKRWARAALNTDDGWPTGVTFFRERLTHARKRQLFMSTVGVYDDFSRYDGPDITKETAITLTPASDRLDLIRWIIPSQALLVGTARSEFSVQAQTDQQVFAVDNVVNIPQTEYGSRLLEPIRVGNAILFIQRAGRKLRELKYDFSTDRYVADDLTVLSEHILDAGVVDMDFQQEPDNIVWCVLADGTLAALTYNRERGVVAWVPHIIGGPESTKVLSVACISSPDGRRDDVWLIVERIIDGATKRYVEFMEDPYLALADTDDAFYVDGGLTYDGAPATTITGLGHLEGETVQILADGSVHADRVVTGGEVSLSRASSKVHVGFNSPARLQTMRLDVQTQAGTSQGIRKSIAEIKVRFLNTIGGRVGPSFDRTDPIPGLLPALPVGTKPALFSGDREILAPAEYGTDGYVCIIADQPLPMTVQAIMPTVEVASEE